MAVPLDPLASYLLYSTKQIALAVKALALLFPQSLINADIYLPLMMKRSYPQMRLAFEPYKLTNKKY